MTSQPFQPSNTSLLANASEGFVSTLRKEPPLLSDVADTLTNLLAHNLSLSTIETYTRHLREYSSWCIENNRDEYMPSSLAKWRDSIVRVQSPNTVALKMAAVKRAISELASPGRGMLIPELALLFKGVAGPSIAANRERLRKTTRILIQPEEMALIVDTPDATSLIGARNRALLSTLAASGLRNRELATLTVQQIARRDGGYVLIVTGKKQTYAREANLSPEAVERIEYWLAMRKERTGLVTPYIFTGFSTRAALPLSTPLSARSIDEIIHTVIADAGLPHLAGCSAHHFRRFVGTWVTETAGIHSAMLALGHARIETTKTYVLSELPIGLTDNLYRKPYRKGNQNL